jgi:hypothetical protein
MLWTDFSTARPSITTTKAGHRLTAEPRRCHTRVRLGKDRPSSAGTSDSQDTRRSFPWTSPSAPVDGASSSKSASPSRRTRSACCPCRTMTFAGCPVAMCRCSDRRACVVSSGPRPQVLVRGGNREAPRAPGGPDRAPWCCSYGRQLPSSRYRQWRIAPARGLASGSAPASPNAHRRILRLRYGQHSITQAAPAQR